MSEILGGGVKLDSQKAHFTDTQTKDERFRNISDIWTSQCMTFEQGLEKLGEQQTAIRDLREPLSAFTPVVTVRDTFAMRYNKTGQEFVPTEHAMTQIAVVGETSDWMLRSLRTDKVGKTKKEPVRFSRDRTDAVLLRDIVKHTLFNEKRIDQTKPRLFRTWTDGTMRAVLSEQYAIVNNSWYVELLGRLIPGGLLSHWRGDADSIYGNVLIPDTIRQESDSAYGGMLSIGNSEIGIRRISSLPSVFRAICMNGCIWEQQKGMAYDKVHRGKIDMEAIEFGVKQNLEKQIPLLPDCIRSMLSTRTKSFGNVAVDQVLAALAQDYKVGKKDMAGIRRAFNIEDGILGKDVRSLFGLTNAVTRHGQVVEDNQAWIGFDEMGGELVRMPDKKWDAFKVRAASFTDVKEIEELIGVAL